MNVTVYDFTGIYENEGFDFYKEGARSLFCSLKDISGTNCICDDYACEEIRKRISASPSENGLRISFFDNGNYHYMSKLLMDELHESAFDLVVFDHHPDMKWTSYGDVLSCGSWVLNAIKDRNELGHVFIIGADKKLMEEAYLDNPEISERVSYFENFASFKEEFVNSKKAATGKLYISVDKDVLSRDELVTNWDQGEMSLEELREGLLFLKDSYGDNIVSVDVCGECTADDPEAFTHRGYEASNLINHSILSVFS